MTGGPVPVRRDLGALEGYHSPQVDVDVRLNTNESPVGPPAQWLAELTQELGRIPFNRYPDRQATGLRQALADWHGVDIGQVFCANGSNEVLQCLLMAYGGPGRRVVLFEPTYSLHRHIARLTGTAVVAGRRTEAFAIDEGEALALLDQEQPVITFLCSPNNPTGRAEPVGLQQVLVQHAPGLLVVDEAYGQFAPHSALDVGVPVDRLVVVRTFSKTWSMAGCRLGYLLADPAVVSSCAAVALPYHLDAVTQAAGRLALRHADAMERRVELIVSERERIAGVLAAMAVQTWPSDANFLLFRPTGKPAGAVWEGLVSRSVLVRDCSRWTGVEACLRVTIGTPSENDRFLAALTETLEEAP